MVVALKDRTQHCELAGMEEAGPRSGKPSLLTGS